MTGHQDVEFQRRDKMLSTHGALVILVRMWGISNNRYRGRNIRYEARVHLKETRLQQTRGLQQGQTDVFLSTSTNHPINQEIVTDTTLNFCEVGDK
jgi:hypothetical protein